jgi:hypothetical protein
MGNLRQDFQRGIYGAASSVSRNMDGEIYRSENIPSSPDAVAFVHIVKLLWALMTF